VEMDNRSCRHRSGGLEMLGHDTKSI
jgi:hypothetical protein